MIEFTLDGSTVSVPDLPISLLDALRDHLGVVAAKDGCAPQGQCGCCTVWVDGQPRVACVTPLKRVRGRDITTVDGLTGEAQELWSDALCATGGSQCGFCTPGIVMRLEALRRDDKMDADPRVHRALAAHQCRCTGWAPIMQAVATVRSAAEGNRSMPRQARDLAAASARATIEGRATQRVNPEVVLGRGGFADDTAPREVPVMLVTASGPVVADSWAEARALAGVVQGRNTTQPVQPPIAVPEVDGAVVSLATSWVDPAYLEPDAAWIAAAGHGPEGSLGSAGTSASPLEHGGAFGGKQHSPVLEALAALDAGAAQPGIAARMSREDVIRLGPKRPPIAAALRADGTGTIRCAAVDGATELITERFPHADVELVQLPGLTASLDLRAALTAELHALGRALAAVGDNEASSDVVANRVELADGGVAEVALVDGAFEVSVWPGEVLDEAVLRSYCYGAVHMACGLVWSEGIAVDADGAPLDLTIRSMGLLRSDQTPSARIEIHETDGPAVHVSDAVFAAAVAAAWEATGWAPSWPTGIPSGH